MRLERSRDDSLVLAAAKRGAITEAIREAVEGMDRDALRRRIALGKAPLHGIERLKPKAITRKRAGSTARVPKAPPKAPRNATAKRRNRA